MTATPAPDLETGGDPDDGRAIRTRSLAGRILSVNWVWLLGVNLLLVLIFGLLSQNNVFWSFASLRLLLLNGTETLLLATAITVLLGAGLIDISVGANLVLSSVLGAIVMRELNASGASPIVSILAGLATCLGTGMLFGLMNGVLVAYLEVNSLVVTLGTTGVGTGIALLITGGSDVTGLPKELQANFALNNIAGFPLPGILALLVVAAIWFMFKYTRFGMRTLAIGSSKASAERAGVAVRRHILTLMVLGGMIAGLAGFVDVSRYAATVILGHTNAPLAAITAAVIGGTVLEGGRVSILGTVMGAALSVLLLGGLTIISVSSFWQLILIGAVLIFAVATDRIRYRTALSR